jgi:hypothetical protein
MLYLRVAASAFGALFLAACTAERFDEPICLVSGQSGPQPAMFADGYFPAEFGKPSQDCGTSSGPWPILSDIEQDWYPTQLRAAHEPSLYALTQCEAPPQFALRFSYIPSFDPSVFIRVQSDGDGLSLIAKQLTGAGGYDPGTLGWSKKTRLTDRQVSELRQLLASEALFEEPPITCDLGFDGSEWIFELVDKDGYRMVKRWSPHQGAAHNLGRFLIELSGWDTETY